MAYKKNPPTINKVEEALSVYATLKQDEPLSIKSSIEFARKGISKAYMMNLANRLAMTLSEIAAVIHVSDRTLFRYTDTHKLDTDASAKILQLQNLHRHGVRVFGDDKRFSAWLRSDIKALDDKKPIEFLDTPFGFELLDQLLGRIEHGIFA